MKRGHRLIFEKEADAMEWDLVDDAEFSDDEGGESYETYHDAANDLRTLGSFFLLCV